MISAQNALADISPEQRIERQEKIIQALIRRADRQNDIGPSAFRAFQSAIALQERVEEQTRDLKRAESELESVRYERERTRRSLVEALSSMADGFALFLDQRLHVTNDFFLNLLPDKADEIAPGLGIDDFFRLIALSGEFVSSDRALADVAACLGRDQTNLAVVVELKDDHWYNLNAQHTSPDNLVILVTEITDLVRRNRFEKESLIDFQNMSSSICTISATGQIIMFNRTFQVLLGLPSVELTAGIHVNELFARLRSRKLIDEDDLAVLSQWSNEIRTQPSLHRRVRNGKGLVLDIQANRLPDGGNVLEMKDVTLEVRNTETLEELVRERTAELTRANNSLRDEYQQKAQVEEELRVAKERVEAAMSSKTRFLAAASHDLLQPINAAQLMISTLKEATRNTQYQAIVDRLDGSFSSAEQLLRSLLDISRLDCASEDEVSVGPVNLGAIMDGIHGDQTLMANQKNIRLDFVPCSVSVRSDALYLLRSIQNLVVNALQYTPSGGRVLVGCRRRGKTVELQVWDTGVGISRRDQKRVFEEFARAENASLGAGMGLGLSVVDRACRLLGHRLTLRSKPDVGSVFSIEMEIAEGVSRNVEPRGFHSSRVKQPLDLIALVIENDEDVLYGTTQWLEMAGASVLAARTVAEATNFVADMGMPPDIILADYQLDDGETGVEAITKIRDMTTTYVPAIMITANQSEGLREAGLLNDVSVLTKPVRLSRLRRLIEWKTENTDKSLR